MSVKSVQFDDGVDGHWVLELAGDPEPEMGTQSSVASPGNANSDTSNSSSLPIYEYLWTLGHFGDNIVGSKRIWREPDHKYDVAYANDVKIYLLFGNMFEWRTSEPIVTVKLMSPAPAGKNIFGRFGKNLESVSKVTAMIPGGGAASKWIEVAADLNAASLPPGDFGWSASKAAFRDEDGPLSGVVWTSPGPMLRRLNGRLSGGLAVSFERSPEQASGVAHSAAEVAHKRAIYDTVRLRATITARKVGPKPIAISLPATGYLALKLNLKIPPGEGQPNDRVSFCDGAI
jgi:hypothetical protein